MIGLMAARLAGENIDPQDPASRARAIRGCRRGPTCATLPGMIKGFKDFILRGNVVELAVAVVIGAAFGLVVTAFTDKIIKPLVNAITPPGSPGLGVEIIAGKDSTYVDFAAVITAALNFVLVAAVVYFVVVVPMNHLKKRQERGLEPEAAAPTEIELLTEIRDLLRDRADRG